MIKWTGCALVADRGSLRFATDHALQAEITHQPRDRASGDFNLFPAQLTPDLPHAVNTKVLRENAQDLRFQDLVTFALSRSALWFTPFAQPLIVG
ncbi:hypothetical protein GCM10007870_30440 [Gluconobacter kondonii]|uniref:Uncharacterized protein n=1 Tax=Gluconobacter kondonii TaxID=941463 RepID=A0ABQ5WVK1_9PROT|nr:hypothetical protein GCM10007870_30440 [Gluconobacter kondonii]